MCLVLFASDLYYSLCIQWSSSSFLILIFFILPFTSPVFKVLSLRHYLLYSGLYFKLSFIFKILLLLLIIYLPHSLNFFFLILSLFFFLGFCLFCFLLLAHYEIVCYNLIYVVDMPSIIYKDIIIFIFIFLIFTLE